MYLIAKLFLLLFILTWFISILFALLGFNFSAHGIFIGILFLLISCFLTILDMELND